MFFSTPRLHSLIQSALQEDSAQSDVSTRLVVNPKTRVQAILIAKESGVVAGLPIAAAIFKQWDRSIQFKPLTHDGRRIKRGTKIALIKGRARSVLTAERPALNILQHLSGIATYAREQVDRLKGTGVVLLDTRKTLPGYRLLQKYAVRCGGAKNHRMSLGDAVMLKENHLQLARLSNEDWISKCRVWMRTHRKQDFQMEIQTQQDLRSALLLKSPRVLLDNLPPRTMRKMIRTLKKQIPGVEIEITGGVKPENLRRLAKLGAHRISMGRLTHSVKAFDISLDITHVYS